jgi:hypothetical protein
MPELFGTKSPTKNVVRSRKNRLDTSAEQFKDHFTEGGYSVKINRGKVTTVDKIEEIKFNRTMESLDGGWGDGGTDTCLSQV